MRAALVRRDDPQPVAEAGRLVQGPELAIGFDKDFLGQVLGRVEVVQKTQRYPVHRVLVPAHERGKSRLITFQHPLYQDGIVESLHAPSSL